MKLDPTPTKRFPSTLKDCYSDEADAGMCARKVDARLPGKENLNSHVAKPVHLICSMI